MPRWPFQKHKHDNAQGPASADVQQVASRARGFVAPPPRTPAPLAADFLEDPAVAHLFARLELLQRELDDAELAQAPDNHWAQRVQLIDESLALVENDLSRPNPVIEHPQSVPSLPLAGIRVGSDQPSVVQFSLGKHDFLYAEAIDWAERGTTVVRGDLEMIEGDLAGLAYDLGLRLADMPLLETSLLALATSLRDRSPDDPECPVPGQDLAILAPCPVCGELALWNGLCLACQSRKTERARLESERQRLFRERDAVLKDRAGAIERLPALRKRVAETHLTIERATKSADLPSS